MTPLESLTKKIHALLPELLELSFGCRITTKKWNSNYSIETITGTYHGEFVEFDCLFRDGRIKANEIAEILGHPVTLEHVLKALGVVGHFYTLYSANENTCWVEIKKGSEPWSLGLPLDKQNPETILFLDDLLPSPNEE